MELEGGVRRPGALQPASVVGELDKGVIPIN